MKRPYPNYMLAVYWLGTLLWSVVVLKLLLKPNSQVSTHDHSLDTFLAIFLNFDFRGYNYIEGLAHIFLFVVLTAMWNLTLNKYVAQSHALRLSFIIALVVAFGTEIGQFFVNRGALLFDLLANILGISIVSVLLRHRYQNRHL